MQLIYREERSLLSVTTEVSEKTDLRNHELHCFDTVSRLDYGQFKRKIIIVVYRNDVHILTFYQFDYIECLIFDPNMK